MEYREAILVTITTVLVVLLMGKTLGLPIAVMLVSGNSMKPTLNPFDLVVGFHPSLTGGVKTGNIVVVVIPGNDWRTTGVIHRVVKIYEENNVVYIVTRGDNVKYNDPPVPLYSVKYVITGRVPNYVTIPSLGILLGFIVGYYALYYPFKRWKNGTLPIPGSLATVIVIVFALFNMAYIGAVYLDSTSNRFSIPISLSERVSEDLRNESIIVQLNYTNIRLLNIEDCFFVFHGEKLSSTPLLVENGSPSTIIVHVPRRLWSLAWNYTSEQVSSLALYPARISSFLSLSCTIKFSEGTLRDTYPLELVWSEPLFVQGIDHSLVIINNNPVPLRIGLVLYDVNISRVVMISNFTATRLGNTTIEIPFTSYGHLIRVMAYYDFLGVHRFYGGYING